MKLKKNKRFVEISREGSALDSQLAIWVDRETGVHYLLICSGYSTSITPLLGSDGQPIIHKIYNEED